MIRSDISNDSYIIQVSRGQPPFLTSDIKGFVIMCNVLSKFSLLRLTFFFIAIIHKGREDRGVR